ncbi:hypothetical protein BGZ51_001948 [Haplosporangium sp. Z 767]|nr:hypothetical protein BGZ51_001948 [Haplosporangium sp. Z 767]KAF9194253.1 hypothetical protein BGZ50_006546 [Haplosporangium sp. Z 11]
MIHSNDELRLFIVPTQDIHPDWSVMFKDLYILAIETMQNHLISRLHKKSAPHLALGVYDTATQSLALKMGHLAKLLCSRPASTRSSSSGSKQGYGRRKRTHGNMLSYKNSVTGLGSDEIAFLDSECSQERKFEMPQLQGLYVIDTGYDFGPDKKNNGPLIVVTNGQT